MMNWLDLLTWAAWKYERSLTPCFKYPFAAKSQHVAYVCSPSIAFMWKVPPADMLSKVVDVISSYSKPMFFHAVYVSPPRELGEVPPRGKLSWRTLAVYAALATGVKSHKGVWRCEWDATHVVCAVNLAALLKKPKRLIDIFREGLSYYPY